MPCWGLPVVVYATSKVLKPAGSNLAAVNFHMLKLFFGQCTRTWFESRGK